jgi:hypothetical protein
MNWTELVTQQINATYAATDGLMKLVKKDDIGWKPKTGKNWMTTGQLLEHLTNACGWCIGAFVSGNWTPPEAPKKKGAKEPKMTELGMPAAESLPTVKSVAEARKKLAADKQVALDAIAKVGEAGLENTMAAAPWDPTQKCLGQQFLLMVGHLAQHKAQLFYYLKLQGKPVNTGHLWGM